MQLWPFLWFFCCLVTIPLSINSNAGAYSLRPSGCTQPWTASTVALIHHKCFTVKLKFLVIVSVTQLQGVPAQPVWAPAEHNVGVGAQLPLPPVRITQSVKQKPGCIRYHTCWCAVESKLQRLLMAMFVPAHTYVCLCRQAFIVSKQTCKFLI